jgi:hypothetical protein
LPELRRVLARERSIEDVAAARQRALCRQAWTVLNWVKRQDVSGRLARIERLGANAQETVADRIAQPLLETAIPEIMEDAAHRLAIVDQCLATRLSRWPIVSVVHGLLGPVASLLRRRLALDQQRGLSDIEALVAMHLRADGRDLSTAVQSTFAQLHQAHPSDVSALYRHNRLWEPMSADAAAEALRRALGAVLGRQREALAERFARRDHVAGALGRALLTWGAVIWFPIAQPIVQALLEATIGGAPLRGGTHIGLLIVQIVSVTFLLKNAAFLLLWFAVLWAYLRWSTQRKVDRQLDRWRSADHADPSLNPTIAAMEWVDELLRPIRAGQERMQKLVARIECAERELGPPIA